MQNKYVGDIGDFGKYGLLRALCGFRDADHARKLDLGIVWYLNPDDNKPGGDHIEYLDDPPPYRSCDPLLFHTLYWVVKAKHRNVDSIGESEIFPPCTVFFEGREDYVPGPLERRKQWLERALTQTADCDLVFLDPDIGLSSVLPRDGRVSTQHTYYGQELPEVGKFARGRSVVIWHQPAHEKEAVQHCLEDMQRKFSEHEIMALTYHRFGYRAFFVLADKSHSRLLRARLDSFLEGPWGQHRSGQKHPHFERIV